MNIGVSHKNYKMHARGNWGQSKNRTDMFKSNKNAKVKNNNKITVNSDYDNNDI